MTEFAAFPPSPKITFLPPPSSQYNHIRERRGRGGCLFCCLLSSSGKHLAMNKIKGSQHLRDTHCVPDLVPKPAMYELNLHKTPPKLAQGPPHCSDEKLRSEEFKQLHDTKYQWSN